MRNLLNMRGRLKLLDKELDRHYREKIKNIQAKGEE